jgi:hypothetical protein
MLVLGAVSIMIFRQVGDHAVLTPNPVLPVAANQVEEPPPGEYSSVLTLTPLTEPPSSAVKQPPPHFDFAKADRRLDAGVSRPRAPVAPSAVGRDEGQVDWESSIFSRDPRTGHDAGLLAIRDEPTRIPVSATLSGETLGNDGFVTINSIPPSICFIDGKQLGPTPKVHLQVSTGTHFVRFVDDAGEVLAVLPVTVAPGQTTMALVNLKR